MTLSESQIWTDGPGETPFLILIKKYQIASQKSIVICSLTTNGVSTSFITLNITPIFLILASLGHTIFHYCLYLHSPTSIARCLTNIPHISFTNRTQIFFSQNVSSLKKNTCFSPSTLPTVVGMGHNSGWWFQEKLLLSFSRWHLFWIPLSLCLQAWLLDLRMEMQQLSCKHKDKD